MYRLPVFLAILMHLQAVAQTGGYTAVETDSSSAFYKLNFKKLAVPAVAVAYGVVGLKVAGVKELDFCLKTEMLEHYPHRTRLDDYTQYAPAALVYTLNAAGIKGKHNLLDRTIVYATSQLISATFVISLKRTIRAQRPDGADFSFPSGHAATAFSSAHFMFKEYKGRNFGLAISGYSFAVFTGVYRMVNNKHWFSDVVAGAGFGILSTELAYYLYPRTRKIFKQKKKRGSAVVMPLFQNGAVGIGWVKRF